MNLNTLLSRRRALFLGVLALGLAGLHAYRLLPRNLEPDVTSPFGVVELRLPGLSASEFEAVLTERVETELLALPDVVGCRSETRDGAALFFAECRNGAGDSEWSAIEARLRRLREELGDDFIGLRGPFLRRPSQRWAEALITLSDAAESSANSQSSVAPPRERGRILADLLRAAPGVDHVERVGDPPEQIVLTYADRDLVDTGLTPLEFREYLRAQQLIAPGAYLTENESILPIETASRLVDFDQLNQLPVRDPEDGDPVNLSRLLDVHREPIKPSVGRVSAAGKPAIALAVYRAEGTPLESFSTSVKSVLSRFRKQGTEQIELVVFQPEVVKEETERFRDNLVQSFVAILILLLLILGIRSGLAVAAVLPFVILCSFILVYWSGFGLDIVTLSTFILVLGLLVDNHIVMAERIHRLKEAGAEHIAAITQAIRELYLPLLAASATTVFGFLPVVLTDDAVGEYVSSLFWVVLFTLVVSLLFCFFVTPFLLRRRSAPARTRPPWPERIYRVILRLAFPLCIPLVLLVGLLCFGGYRIFASADQVFFPSSDRALWILDIEFPHGTGTEKTERVARTLAHVLKEESAAEDAALEHWVTFFGRSAPPFQASIPYRELAPHYAQALLKLDPERDTARLESRLRSWMRQQEEPRTRLRPVRLGAQLEWPIQVEISGPQSGLGPAANRVIERLEADGCVNVGTDRESRIRKLRVIPDREALAARDLTVSDLTVAMHSVLFGLPVFDLKEGDSFTPVMLRARAERQSQREALSDAYVYPKKGEPALLYEVASVEETLAYPVLGRKHGAPAITVRAESADPDRALALEAAVDDWLPELREQYPDHTFEVAGLSAAADRANRAILDEMPWAFLLVILCLLFQSRSILETTLILLTIPLSFTGVAYGLWVTGQPFSFMTLVGMTALAGIVVNNAIVLLASIRRRKEDDGDYSREGLIDSASERLRPILLTTLCALASMAVLYHSGGLMWRPLATAVSSGLLFSTALVLFVLPVLYGVARELSQRMRG